MIAADLPVKTRLNFNSTRRSIEHEKDKQGGNNAARSPIVNGTVNDIAL